MKKNVILLLLLTSILVQAQNNKKPIALTDLYKNHTFVTKGIAGLRSMNDGEHYTTLQNNKIEKYNYADGKLAATLFDAAQFKELKDKTIQGYEFSSNENYILFYVDKKSIYRHSFTAEYYVYRPERKKLEALSANGPQQVATFSPDERKVAFVRNNNLYIKKLDFGTESQVTTDGAINNIINGVPDWVYEEEFRCEKTFDWSPDSRYLGYLRFDESKVKTFSFPMYEGADPDHKENEYYPSNYSYKYPKAGEENSTLSLHIYDLSTLKSEEVTDLNITKDDYIPRIRWSPVTEKLAVFKLNRHQNELSMYYTNPKTLISQLAMKQTSNTYIDEDAYEQFTFLNDGKYFVYLSEKDGYQHLYLYNLDGSLKQQITKGNFDVMQFIGYDEKSKLFYYQAAEKTPLEREIYAIDLKGKQKCLTPEPGTNNITFSKNFHYYIHTYSNVTTPPLVRLYNSKGKLVKTLEDNAQLKSTLAQYQFQAREFFTFKNATGISLNGWMIKPVGFDPNKQYPVVMTQYSGPNSQQVKNSWGLDWYQCLADQGYVVACIDGRGTGARGEEFRKCTYLQLGKYESDDQISGASYLGSLPYINKDRIAIWGWSFGGFMTELCMTKGNGIFKAGIAVAPVSHWKFYDSIYTERYMRTPKENGQGYDNNSPLGLASQLKGKLLICHGTADDNVHYQNTAEFSERLVQAGIPFDMAIYTNRNHSIYDSTGNTRLHLFTKFCTFLHENL